MEISITYIHFDKVALLRIASKNLLRCRSLQVTFPDFSDFDVLKLAFPMGGEANLPRRSDLAFASGFVVATGALVAGSATLVLQQVWLSLL